MITNLSAVTSISDSRCDDTSTERLSGAWNIWAVFGVALLLLAMVIALGGLGTWDAAMLETLTGTGSGASTQVTAGFDAD